MDLGGISMNLIKNIATDKSVPLAHVFNISLTMGMFPSILKIKRIVPMYKTGDPELCDNY
jgi:hypothetical protein